MKKIISSAIATLAALSFTTAAFPADAEKPVVPAGPVYATVPGGEVQNDAEIAETARRTAETKEAEARAEAEAEEAAIQAGKKAATAKAKADALKDASSAPR